MIAMQPRPLFPPPPRQHGLHRAVAGRGRCSAWSGWPSSWAALLKDGISALSPTLFTEITPPPGSKGGLANAIVGSVVMSLVAVLLGTPIGLFAGTYLAEYARHGRLAFVVRFVNDILLSAPSIVTGLFIYELVVVRMGHFSGMAGAAVPDGDRDPGGGAHHREHAAAGAQRPARSRQRAGRAAEASSSSR